VGWESLAGRPKPAKPNKSVKSFDSSKPSLDQFIKRAWRWSRSSTGLPTSTWISSHVVVVDALKQSRFPSERVGRGLRRFWPREETTPRKRDQSDPLEQGEAE